MKLKKLILTCLICTVGVSAYAADKSTYMTSDGDCTAAKVVYEYKPDSLFNVNVQMGFISDIQLKAGEKVINIDAGDTKRWLIDQATVGGTAHVYIKPLAPGIQTNMIINTEQHSYRLYLVSVSENYTPIVQFVFPEESSFRKLVEKPLPWKNKEEKNYYDVYMTQTKSGQYVEKKINKKYKVKKHGQLETSLYPSAIFDDGIHTYIQMPRSNKYDLPTLYNVDDSNKLTLVNYRVKNGYIIADRVFRKARLCYSTKTYLDIMPSGDGSIYRGGDK